MRGTSLDSNSKCYWAVIEKSNDLKKQKKDNKHLKD
jgi:hypothetical protein